MPGDFGYAGRILKVDLSRGSTDEIPTADYANRFLGGRGVAAKIYWDEVPPDVGAFDPENQLIFVTGPLAGFTGLAGSRWQVCGKSPAISPELFSYANAGGSWGTWLKSAGYDGVAIKGESNRPVYLFISDVAVEIRDASSLWGKTTIEAREIMKQELGKGVRVVATGPAGENAVSFATLLADEDSSASSGFGSVMGSKKLKAIAVAGNWKPMAANPERLQQLSDHLRRLRKGAWDTYAPAIRGRRRPHACYGCIVGCVREVYEASTGERGKFFCQSSEVYRKPALDYYGEWNEAIFHANRLCDKYGLDTAVMQPMITWLSRCHQEGVLTDEETGLPLSKIGSLEFIESLVRKISLREGFGDVLAQGIIRAAALVGKGSEELIGDAIATRGSEITNYDPRLYIITGLLYATEPRKPIQQIHELTLLWMQWLQWVKGDKGAFLSTEVLYNIAERFWGMKKGSGFPTYEDAAIVAKRIQDRTYAKESLILCDWSWPIMWVRSSEDHVGDPSLQSEVLSAVLGRKMDEEQLNRIGERIFNLQRAILVKEGRGGREGDSLLDVFHTRPLQHEHFNRRCLVIGEDGEPISKKGAFLEREQFEKMKSEYYELRGWDVGSGLQTKAKLEELDLGDIAKELEAKRLVT
jgi:aldehyde:ferredoxin oxidoreductase